MHDPYAWPSLYDLEHAHAEDVAFYRSFADGAGGPVLELACGNGRLTLPLLQDGHTVYALDISVPMLDDLDRKLAERPPQEQERLVVAEASFTEIPEEWPLFSRVMLPYNALHHCRSHRDVLAMLASVREHLAPGGTLALDCYLPDFSFMLRDPKRRYEVRHMEHPEHPGETMVTWEHSWYEAQRQIHHIIYVYQRPHGERIETHLPLRMFYPQELEALLDWAGWRVVYQASDFVGAPVTDDSLKLVLELEPQR